VELPASAECLSQEVLDAWVGGRLPAAELARVEAHVAGCAACLHRVGVAARDDRARALDSTDAAVDPPAPGPWAEGGGWAQVESWATAAPPALASALPERRAKSSITTPPAAISTQKHARPSATGVRLGPLRSTAPSASSACRCASAISRTVPQ